MTYTTPAHNIRGPDPFPNLQDMPWRERTYLVWQFRVRKIIFYPMFDNFFLMAILANAMTLAVDYAGGLRRPVCSLGGVR